MASRPPLNLPQPATFYDRVRSAFAAFRGSSAPVAQPVELATLKPTRTDIEAKPVQGQISRAYGGFSVDWRWMEQLALNDDTILQREGGHDLKLYDSLLDDDVAASAFQQRRLAVISRDWEVEPGDESAAAQEAADHLRDQLKNVGWDGICDKMLFGRWYGYAVGELMFEVGPDGKYRIADILVPDRKAFAFTNAGELRLKTVENPQGEALPPNKFWAFRCGASHDFTPYGTGLAHWVYWPVWFKKNVIKFWAVYLEKFGMPTTLGTFPHGADAEVMDKTLEAAKAVASDRAVAKPDDVQIELLAEGRSSNDSYLQFVGEMNDAVLRIILSQTGTSKSEAQGLGGSQSDVMKDVRDEVVKSDSDLLHESFNRGPVRWLTEWNFGKDVAPPRVYRKLEEEDDLDTIASRDQTLKALGWERTPESFADTYGEGYEYTGPTPEEREAARAAALEGNKAAVDDKKPTPKAANDDKAEDRRKRAAEFAAMDPEPLYVYRELQPESARKLRAWAEKAGVKNLLPVGELHVTVLYSKKPVDWFELAGDWLEMDGELKVGRGGPRKVEKFGDKGAIVLQFASGRLKWRHSEMVERGASHDYDDYLPHVTVGYDPDFDVEAVEPYIGELTFGPEIFETIVEDWVERVVNFAAEDLDAIDRWSEQLAKESDPLIAEFAATVRGRVAEGIENADQLRVVLLDALEKFPSDRLAELAGVPFVAARASAEAGIEAAG